MEVGGSTVTITNPAGAVDGGDGENMPGADGIVVIEFEGDAADAAVDGATAGDDEITLASAVVDIVIGNDGNLTVSCSDGQQCVNVTFVLAADALGTADLGACTVPTLFGTLSSAGGAGEDCVAGCCVEMDEDDDDESTTCECDSEEVRGPKCEQRLRCSTQREAGGERNFDACSTDASGKDNVVCVCEEFRRIAVFAHKVASTTRRPRPQPSAHVHNLPPRCSPRCGARSAQTTATSSRVWQLPCRPACR